MKQASHLLPEKSTPIPPNLRLPIERSTAILKEFGAEAIYLFGSIVEGTFHDDSDLDMAVSGLAPNNFFEAMGRIGLTKRSDLAAITNRTRRIFRLEMAGKK